MMAQHASAATVVPTPAIARKHGARLAALSLGILIALWAHRGSVGEAVAVWNRSDTYGFSWVVLPTVCFLVWYRRPHFVQASAHGSVWGVVGAASAAVLWIAADLMNVSEGRQLALLAGVLAVVLASVGLPAFRRLMPILALLVFLVPTGSFLLTPLKLIAVRLLGMFAAIYGMPFSSEGFTVFIGEQRYVVINDCAGLPYVLIGLFLGLTLGLLIYRRAWKIAAMTLLGGALAVFGNSLRIILIAVYDHLSGAELDFAGHVAIERPAMGLAFVALFVIFAFLRGDQDFAQSQTKFGEGAVRRTPFVASLTAALVVAVTPLAWGAHQQEFGANAAMTVLPVKLASWSQEATATALDWTPSVSDASFQLSGYSRGNQSIAVFVAQAEHWRDEVSDGSVDLMGKGDWMLSRQAILPLCFVSDCRDVRYSKYVWPNGDRVRHVYSVHAIGEWTTLSTISLRLNRALAQLNGTDATPRLIAVAVDGTDPLAPQELAGVFQTLVMR